MDSEAAAKSGHWSGTFQRLRAEVVILAVIIFVTTQVDVVLTKVPILGIELEKPLPRGTLEFFLYSLFFYFLASWFVRYFSERADALLPITSLDAYIARIDEQIRKVETMDVPESSHYVSSVEQINKSLLQHITAIDGELTHNLQAIGSNFDRAESFLVRHPDGTDPSFPSEGAVYDLIRELRRFITLVENPEHALRKIPQPVRELIRELRMDLNQNAGHLIAQINEKGPSISEAANTFKTEMRELRRELNTKSRAIYMDRQLLGTLIPFIFSVGLVAISLPQGIEDMAPAFRSASSCLLDLDVSCLQRLNSPRPTSS